MKDPRDQFHFDCRHMVWSRPCRFHKEEGVRCRGCPHYDPVKTRMLLVKLAADGDVLRTTGILSVLAREFPGLHLTWATAPSAAPLLENHPQVDRILVTGRGVPPELLAEEFDLVICPDADPFSAALASVGRTGRRRGYTLADNGVVRPLSKGAREWLLMGLDDDLKKKGDRAYQDILQDVLELPERPGPPELYLTEEEKERALQFRRAAGIPEDRPLVGLNTGAGARWPQKQWTYEGFLELGRRLTAKGRSVLLLGGPSEEERNRRLLAEGGAGFYDAGSRNPVRDFAARLGLCDVLVTGDTLALHLGVAAGIPVVALFGPTSSAEIDLFGKGEKILPEGLDCLCCYRNKCDKKPNCMDLITVERVFEAVERLLP